MTTQLQPSEIRTTAQYCRDCAIALMDMIGILQSEIQQLRSNGASPAVINAKYQEISEINTRISQLVQKANDLDAKAILNILVSTDVLDAIVKITGAKDKVLKAVEKINDVRRALQIVDLFIRIAGAIVSAATTGNPAAQIKLIFDAINNIP